MTEAEIEYLEDLAEWKRLFVKHCNKLKVKVKSMSNEELSRELKHTELNYYYQITEPNVPMITKNVIKAHRDYELNIYRSELRRRNLNG